MSLINQQVPEFKATAFHNGKFVPVTQESFKGKWSVVVMNADGRPGIAMGADLGAKVPALPWIGIGLLVGGALVLAGGVFLVVDTFRSNRTTASEG